MKNQLKAPVLFLIYRRPDTTKRVFEQIRKAQPKQLFIAADGPKQGEEEKCKRAKEVVMDNIDWDCKVKTLFRDKNLGCKYAVSGAIDWFFENVEEGIILEDDTLPNQSFFRFCEELLKRYRDDERVMHISGNNFQFGWQRDKDYSYYFSYYGSIWGWATWKRAWKLYDVEMKFYPKIKGKGYLRDIFKDKREAEFRKKNFDSILSGADTWDYQWAFARLVNRGLSIVPKTNLVSNIGFGEDAVRTINPKSKRSKMKVYNINFPLCHPDFVIRDTSSDNRYFANFILCTGIKKIVRSINIFIKNTLTFVKKIFI